MKLMIDISKDRYDEIMAMDWKNCRRFFDEEIRAIHDGKAIEQEPCDIYTEGYFKGYEDGLNRKLEPKGVEQYIDSIAEECEDCISRQAAMDACDQSINYLDATDRIRALPSVTPAQKTGYWIIVNERAGIYRCGVCNELSCCSSFYCHNCGTKMEQYGSSSGTENP